MIPISRNGVASLCFPVSITEGCRRNMRVKPQNIAADGIRAANRLLPCIVAGLVSFAAASSAMAETSPRKNPAVEDAEAPAPKKKVRPKVTPKPDPDRTDAAASGASTKAKVKAVNTTPSPKAKKTDVEPEASRLWERARTRFTKTLAIKNINATY